MNALAGHANSYHSYCADEALAGIAEAGYRHVELSAVPGWTEHVDVHGDPAETRAQLEHYGLAGGLDQRPLGPHDRAQGLEHGLAVVRWAERFGVPIVNTAIGGHAHVEESEDAFMANIGTLADAAQAAGLVDRAGDPRRPDGDAARCRPRCSTGSATPRVKVNYDTANVEHYGGVRAEDDLPAIADRVANVHLKDMRGGMGDWDFPAIGEGHVDFGRVLEILRDAGYDGPYAVEIEFAGEPWPPLRRRSPRRCARRARRSRGTGCRDRRRAARRGLHGPHARRRLRRAAERARCASCARVEAPTRVAAGAARRRGHRRLGGGDRRARRGRRRHLPADAAAPPGRRARAGGRPPRAAREADRAHARGRRRDRRRGRRAAACSMVGHVLRFFGRRSSSCAACSPPASSGGRWPPPRCGSRPLPDWNDWMLDPSSRAARSST